MILAIEDRLGEALVRKVLAHYHPDLQITTTLGFRGKDFLRSKAAELNRTARHLPVILLIDLDSAPPCPAAIAATWFPNGISPHMRFRAAVFEVESWLLADRQALADFLKISLAILPDNPDLIPKPKEHLINLARRSRARSLRDEIVPQPGSSASVGPGYNPRLCQFVENEWNPHQAQGASLSLRKFIHRLDFGR